MEDQWALALSIWEKIVKEFRNIDSNAPSANHKTLTTEEIMKSSITPNKFVSVALEILEEHYKMNPNMNYHPQDIAANIGSIIYTMGESMGVIPAMQMEREAIANNLFDYIDSTNNLTEEQYNKKYKKEYFEPELPLKY